MNKPIEGEFRRQFEETFADAGLDNPHITESGREECRGALDVIEGVVRGEISRGLPSYIDADDLIQECAIRLPAAIKAYRGKGGASVKTYLKTVIRNDVMDLIKLERREPIHSPFCDGSSDVRFNEDDERDEEISWSSYRNREDSGEEHELTERDKSRLKALFTLLTKEQLIAVLMCHHEGLTQEQAAKRLGITRNAVKSRLRKASLVLQKQFSKKSGSRYQFPNLSSLSR
jgi:RNA polymerase sigma factor (sigma-70 family)